MARYIIKEREHAHGGLFELEIEYYYDVFDTVEQKVIMTFERQYTASYNGVDWSNGSASGLNKIEISPDEKFVIVHYGYKPEPDKFPLP